jgi:L-alanine-DL-glutamate epimerase-like enolase superfamily enzyme
MDIRVCRAVREAVGDDMDLMLDPVCAYNRRDALRVGRVLQELNFYWYEDPIPGTDIEGLADLSQALDIPIAVGETMPGLQFYSQYLVRHAGDIIRIVGDRAGGITAMMKLARMCEGFNVNCEPHSYGSILSQATHLHVMLAIRNCDFFEFPVPVGIFDVGMKDTIRIAEDGYVYAPTKPGLGYEIDWDSVDNLTVREI